MTTQNINHYGSFLKHCRRAERAIGRYIVGRIEGGATWAELTSMSGPVYVDGKVKGSDRDAHSIIALSGVSRKRIAAALADLRSSGGPVSL